MKYDIILIVSLLLALIVLSNFNIIEPLDENTSVVLLGDSVFDNSAYASSSIEYLMQEKHKNTLRLAKDGATIEDLPSQVYSIPSQYDKGDTILIISVGGNDLLNKYIYNQSTYNSFDDIFNDYKEKIDKISKRNFKIVLCNIYYPPFHEFEPYYDIIKKWNDSLDNYAEKNKYELLKLDTLMTSPSEFSNYIEPSSSGGVNIVDKILNLD